VPFAEVPGAITGLPKFHGNIVVSASGFTVGTELRITCERAHCP